MRYNVDRWNDIRWMMKGLEIFESLLPAPPPFLPVPRGLVMRMNGLDSWRVYVLRAPNIMEDGGMVYGADQEEAEEAAENKFGKQPGVMSIEVVKE